MLDLIPDQLAPAGTGGQPIALGRARLVADRTGALFWPAERVLIVADLHLEKGSAGAAWGRLLPPYDTRATLLRLAEAAARLDVETVIALGDSLHDAGAVERIAAGDLELLLSLQRRHDWIWITGNHDPQIDRRLGGKVAGELRMAGLILRHEPAAGGIEHEIAGHLHPAARLSIQGHSLRRPCFVGNGRRLVLPAFGAYTGGLNVLDAAFQPVLGDSELAVWMLGAAGVYPVPAGRLRGD